MIKSCARHESGYIQMKKIMTILVVLMCFISVDAFAQLKEVRGVQTRMVEYQSDEYRNSIKYTRHGFEFKNENNFSVWVEAELWMCPYTINDGRRDEKEMRESIIDTKNFTLYTGDSYVWKCSDKMYDNDQSKKEQFYVKYKAYKAE